MIDEVLQEQAALYAAGTLSATEREDFALILRFHTELRTLVTELEEIVAAACTRALPSPAPRPSAEARTRLFAMIKGRAQQTRDEAFVMCGPDGLVQWVNPAFTAMCGYELDELRGKKLGPILQGAQTDRAAAERMGGAVREHRACTETILNYHKNGQPYWVEIAITPILDETGATRWLVAQEREVPERAAA